MVEYLSISKIIKKHRGKYDQAFLLSETDGNDITYFVAYNLKIICESITVFTEYLNKKLTEKKNTTARLREDGFTSRQIDVINELNSSDSPLSIYELSSKLQNSYALIRRDLQHLMQKGYVVEMGRGGHKSIYSISDQKRF